MIIIPTIKIPNFKSLTAANQLQLLIAYNRDAQLAAWISPTNMSYPAHAAG